MQPPAIATGYNIISIYLSLEVMLPIAKLKIQLCRLFSKDAGPEIGGHPIQ